MPAATRNDATDDGPTDDAATEAQGTGPADGEPRTGVGRFARRALMVAGIASAMLWIGAIVFGGNYKPAGWLKDRTFPKAAEKICKTARHDLRKYPDAHLSKTPADRAKVVDATTDRLAVMVTDLRAITPGGKPGKAIDEWLDDWEVHLADRHDFARRLRAKGRSQEFLETKRHGEQVTRAVDNYAELNEMADCATPGDV